MKRMDEEQYNILADMYTSTWKRAALYDHNYRRFKDAIHDLEQGFVAELVKLILPLISQRPSLSVLDLGCGDGKLTLNMLEGFGTCFEYLGVDINERILRDHAILKWGLEACLSHQVVCSDMNAFLSDSKFDVIVSLNSLYACYLENILRFTTLLREDGVFAVLMNSSKGAFSKLRRVDGFSMSSGEDLEAILARRRVEFKSVELSGQVGLGSRWWTYLCREERAESEGALGSERELTEVERALLIPAQGSRRM